MTARDTIRALSSDEAIRDAEREQDIEVLRSAYIALAHANQEDMTPVVKVCIGCEAEQGKPHQPWCPVVTGTLNSLSQR